LVVITINLPYSDPSDTERTQAAKYVLGDLDALMGILERIQNFFKRVEEFADVPRTTDAMEHVVVKIMAEVLGIFGILTKEIKKGRASELITDRTCSVADRDIVIFLKKHLKKRKDIEGALKKLDGSIYREFMMAVVPIWKSIYDTLEDANNKLLVARQAGTLGTLVTHMCHTKPTCN
jgi:hypothetical protein